MKDDKQLIRDIRDRINPGSRDVLIEKYLPLVTSIARKFQGRGEPVEDLIQIGTIGLIKAIDRYDPERGFELSTYAMPNISGEIRRHFRDKTATVRVPRPLQELNLKLYKRLDPLTIKLGRPPTLQERALDASVTPQEASQALASSQPYVSLGFEHDDDESLTILSTLGEDDFSYELMDLRMIMREGLDSLTDEERELIYKFYFEGLPQSVIAEELGVSQMYVGRILKDALEKVKDYIGDI